MFNVLSIYIPILLYKTLHANHSAQKQLVTLTRNLNTVLLLCAMLAGHIAVSEDTTIKSKEVDLEIFTEKENKGDEGISEEADDCESHILKILVEYV